MILHCPKAGMIYGVERGGTKGVHFQVRQRKPEELGIGGILVNFPDGTSFYRPE